MIGDSGLTEIAVNDGSRNTSDRCSWVEDELTLPYRESLGFFWGISGSDGRGKMNDLTRCIRWAEELDALRLCCFFASVVDNDSVLATSLFVDSGVAIWLNGCNNSRTLFDEPVFSEGDEALGLDIGEALLRRKEGRVAVPENMMDARRPWDAERPMGAEVLVDIAASGTELDGGCSLAWDPSWRMGPSWLRLDVLGMINFVSIVAT